MIDSLCVGAAAAAIPAFIGCGMSLEPIGRYSDNLFSIKVPVAEIAGKVRDEADLLLQKQTLFSDGEAFTSMHPVALYGFLLCIFSFFVLLILRGRIKQKGNLFTVYLVLNAVSTLVLESVKVKCGTILQNSPVSLNIIISVLILITAFLYSFFEWRKARRYKFKQ